MKQTREFNLLDFLRYVRYSYLPNPNDNIKQVLTKLLFIISLAVFIVSGIYIGGYFINTQRQENLIDDNRKIWYQTNTQQNVEFDGDEENLTPQIVLLRKNTDFKGWITIGNTKVDNPIYHTDNNDFYLNHNQEKNPSAYGALYFDYRNTITKDKIDKHLVIYGHEMKNGSMFGELKKLRSLSFYKNNPTFEFNTLYSKGTYKIYSIFVLNASKADDNNYIYNILGQNFVTEEGFNTWVGEAKQRSLINTNVDVKLGDDTVALVTCCNDFPNARLVVMARKTRDGEDTAVDTRTATLNPNPRYPKIWYDKRNINYPF